MSIRYIGLDIHKQYAVIIGINAEHEVVLESARVLMHKLESWGEKHLLPTDEIIFEMTVNAWQTHDVLAPLVASVTVAHTPHIALVTRDPVKTDRKAAYNLARLLAAGMVESVWVPPQEVRELRALILQRKKLVKVATKCKLRLHAVMHRHNLVPPVGGLFKKNQAEWWDKLPLTRLEKAVVQADLDMLHFTQEQIKKLEFNLKHEAAQDERVPYLVQMPGFRYLTAMTVLAAVGDISRFESHKKLVGYAGLGARAHHSGTTHKGGKITKKGRKDLRTAMVQVAHAATKSHPYWRKQLERLQPRLGYQKAIVALARRMLVAVWHVLTYMEPDRRIQPYQVARKMMVHASDLGRCNRGLQVSLAQATRDYLTLLGIGDEITHVRWSPSKVVELPPPE